MAEYPQYPIDLHRKMDEAMNQKLEEMERVVGREMAARRAKVDVSRYMNLQKEYMELHKNSRAYVPIPAEDDFPIKFNYKDRSCKEFHSLMERKRGESKPNVDLRYRIAKLLILGLVLQLIVEIIKCLT